MNCTGTRALYSFPFFRLLDIIWSPGSQPIHFFGWIFRGMSGATATATALIEAAEPEVPASDCSSQWVVFWCCNAPCSKPHACPFTGYAQAWWKRQESPKEQFSVWYLMHNCFHWPSLVFASVNHWTLPLPFDFPLPLEGLPLPLLLDVLEKLGCDGAEGIFIGRGLNRKSPGKSWRMWVNSCRQLSISHPRSDIKSAIAAQIWRSAACASVMDAHLNMLSGSTFWVRKLRNLAE